MSLTVSKSTGRINRENADKTFVDILHQQSQQIPQCTAVVHLETVLTFAELDAMSDALAAELIKNGVRRGDRVGICPSRTEIIPLCLFGVFKAGAAYVPLDPNYPAKRLLYMIEDADIRTVLSEAKFFDRFTDFTGTVIDARQVSQQPISETISFPTITPDDLAAVIYTSGSTGTPKGVQLRHHNLMSVSTHYKNLHNITQNDVMSAYAGFSFVANVFEYYPSILSGAALHFIDDSIRLDPRAVNRYFEDNHITIAFLPTAFGYRFITQIKNNSLRFATLAGERFIPIEQSLSSFEIFNAYGTTECASYISTTQILPGQQHITVGTANDNMEIYIVNENNELVPAGESGELCVAGRQIGFGYLHLPEKTAHVFVQNPFNDSPDYARMYHTGDVARMDENGQIEIRGRLDHQVKIRGFRVELGEIDTVALQCPGIAEAVTVTVPSPDGENRLVIYVSSPTKVEPKTLQSFIGEALPPYMVPAIVVQIDKLPRNFSGKIDRAALPAVELPTAVEVGDLPQTDTEKTLADIVAKILKIPVESIGVNTDLFGFGLDSLLVFDLILEVQKQFNAELTPEHVTQNPTISALVTLLSSGSMESMGIEKSEIEEDVDALYPLTFHQQSLLNGYFADPNNIKDNLSWKYDFSETTDIEKLASATKTAILAHPLLSARLVKDGDVYFWQRNNTATISIEIDEMSDEDFNHEEETFIRPFNLVSGEPLYRIKIYKLPSSVKMLFDIHHSIFDGFAKKILLEDIIAGYLGKKIVTEKPSALTAGLLEQNQVDSADIEEKCNELARRIKQCGNLTKLNEEKQLDKPAGYAVFYEGKPFSATEIHNFCTEHDISPNSIFISAFASVAARHSVQKDALFAFIMSGRDQNNFHMVGAFIKTVLVLIQCDTNKSLLENCRTAEENMKLSAQCANTILIKSSTKPEWQNLSLSLSFPPLLYIFHGNLLDAEQMPLLEGKKVSHTFIQKLDAGNQSVPFIPLEFIVEESKGKFSLNCKYNCALFDKQFIVQFITEIETLIEQLITGTYEDGTRYPLSEEQRKYYSYWSLTGGMVMMPLMLKFPDHVDTKKLAESFCQVIHAHPFLKANIQIIDGEPYWKRQDAAEVTPVNICHVSQEELTNLLNGLAERKEFNPDLTKEPLYFAEIYTTDDAVYLVLAFHHIYYDGVTRNIIIDDLISAYNGIKLSLDGGLGIKEGSYEKKYRNNNAFQASRQYYEKLFQHYRTPLRLTSECGEPQHTAKTVTALVEADHLQKFCTENKIFPNILFLTGLCVTASKFSGEEYVFFTTETAGRNGRPLAKEAGLFVRNFPLILKVDKNLSGLPLVTSLSEQYYRLLNQHSGFTSGLATQHFGFSPNFNYLFQAGVASAKPAFSEPSYVDMTQDVLAKVFKSVGAYFDCDVQIFESKIQDKDHFIINARYDTAVYSETLMQNFVNAIRDCIEEFYR
ncbi:MAG: amino acid adenylation domain-containing protein [Planctomycetaceae bacterium]|jgi:amino acid adenylation domain-containing protein|nr:amino acid adenylation domain-containing protein [Planctomycetaceae bacterium]